MRACSRMMARSTTCSMVLGAIEDCAAACGWVATAAAELGANWACSSTAGGCSAISCGDCAVCWAAALSEVSRKAAAIHFVVRIALSLSGNSVSQLENHVHDCGRIYRRAIAQCRFEFHFVGGGYGSFIQAVTHAAHHAIDVQLSVRAKHHFEQNFAFKLQLTSFLGVNRIGFIGDLNRVGGRAAVELTLGFRAELRHLLGAESAGGY